MTKQAKHEIIARGVRLTLLIKNGHYTVLVGDVDITNVLDDDVLTEILHNIYTGGV